ncbi:Glucose--fructose oxidoreductase precursor [Rubripirellula lacrimiformis]|uniref:Glucose--fructose oxidoreductase n=1 Tax=Rubripirellula lacrimiformis TaxID=1930273 RepID=A0A517N553_9BACT|nr:Gfo/Idh/MocA family oxidoreductase [Rubripirellula lacrimiformis]QDT02269.1 Glucose--fructose oxidoreductase precursor [Rubripirellula lacrimiformis]
MASPNRRQFFQHLAATGFAASATISGTKSSGQVIGANDRVRVAIAGINGRGQVHMGVFGAMKNVEITHLVDPDSRLFASRSAAVQRLTGKKPKCVQDIREVLDDQSVDAVSIATPNHWHALMTIWACQAGKDVYVEKPCSHNISEGRRMVEAAQKFNRIVQHGTQWRSDPKWQTYTTDIRDGKYGKLQTANIQIFRPRKSIGIQNPVPPPRELDYELWTGPAPMNPYRTNLVHYRWHWMWDYGDGEIANLGAHEFEMARWAMPETANPKSVVSLGGRYGYEDQADTPNTQLTLYDFGDTKLVCQQRGLHFDKPLKMSIDFHTDEGRIQEGKFYPHGKEQGEVIEGAPPSGLPQDYARDHFQNFIDCVRSRKSEDLASDVLDGHRTAILAHLGNISYRLGDQTSFRNDPQQLSESPIASESFEAMKHHLVDVAGVNLAKASYRIGRSLQFDATTETFVDSPEANQLLGGNNRPGFD